MTMITKFLAGGAGLAALAAVAPASAQYYPYRPVVNTQVAAQQCAAAVQARLNRPTGVLGVLGILGTSNTGRVLSITRIDPRRRDIHVRGLATSNMYGPYGIGAYGAYGYRPRADLSFRCSVDYRGFVRDVDINRR